MLPYLMSTRECMQAPRGGQLVLFVGCHNNDMSKMADGGRQHGTITVHSPELCDMIFGPSREDTVRSKVINIVSFLNCL